MHWNDSVAENSAQTADDSAEFLIFKGHFVHFYHVLRLGCN